MEYISRDTEKKTELVIDSDQYEDGYYISSKRLKKDVIEAQFDISELKAIRDALSHIIDNHRYED